MEPSGQQNKQTPTRPDLAEVESATARKRARPSDFGGGDSSGAAFGSDGGIGSGDQNAVRSSFALELEFLKQMILLKPERDQRTKFLADLLEFATCNNSEIRKQGLSIAKELYENEVTHESVAGHMTRCLRYLLELTPPNVLFGPETGRTLNTEKWTEESIKSCLYLHLYLLPTDHSLIHELTTVYVEAQPSMRRVILRQLETPIPQMGMESPDLLSCVKSCPKGAETLVARITHLLTERTSPSIGLVNIIRDLYQRVPDVRFLIPVLTCLTKEEIVTALPKLIKLNQNVVKDLFNRLLTGHNEEGKQTITPSELLIALNQLDPSQVDMKTLINATRQLLRAHTRLYTKEVMTNVIQQLAELNPLPVLLMRTVLKALSARPRLRGFVVNILQQLIMKEVWKQPLVWEGFVKCCQKTKPQSFEVLLQLPPTQLTQVFTMAPNLRDPLLQHINSLSAPQQALITPVIMKLVQADPAEDIKTEPVAVRETEKD